MDQRQLMEYIIGLQMSIINRIRAIERNPALQQRMLPRLDQACEALGKTGAVRIYEESHFTLLQEILASLE